MTSVALCFYGQPRFINNPEIARSYHKAFFSNPNYQVDCYGHVWYNNDAVYESTSWVKEMPTSRPREDTLSTLYRNYNFRKLMVEEPRQFRLHDRWREKYRQLCENTPIPLTETRENNTLSHLYSKAASLMFAGSDYDFYVSCRYDTVLTDIPDLSKMPNDKMILPNNHPNFSDTVMIFGKKFLPWGKNLYIMIHDRVFEEARNHGFMPEVFKMYSYYAMGYSKEDIIYTPMFGHIQRSE
jgi:hypothetical protein